MRSVLMECKDDWDTEYGEVYEVSAACLEALDLLEGVRNGYYYQRAVNVVVADGTTSSCIAYFYPASPELL